MDGKNPRLTAILALCVATLSTAPLAAQCETGWRCRQIGNGAELPRGVPNYAQASFEPGSDDCGPVALAMIAGFHDANGWPNIMRGGGPYTAGKIPSMAVDNTVEVFKTFMNYRKPGPGTPHASAPLDWWARVGRTMRNLDPSTSGWTFEDDFFVHYRGDVVTEIDSGRPFNFQYFGFNWDGRVLRWNSRTGPGASDSIFLAHHMPALGYEHEPAFWFPEEWIVLRSGWRNGGDSRVYYRFNNAWKSAFRMRPAGSASSDSSNRAFFFKGDRFAELNLDTQTLVPFGTGHSRTIKSVWSLPTNFQSDIDAAVHAGRWGKVYFFKGNQYIRYDITSDKMDSGYPKAIAGNWPLDSHFHSNLDAASTNGELLYFHKGNRYQSVDLATGRPRPAAPEPVASHPDAAVHTGNGKILYFQGSKIQARWNIAGGWDPGYPKSIGTEIPHLFSSIDAAFHFAHPLSKRDTVARGEEKRYSISVPGNSSTVAVLLRSTRGTGDADLYSRRTINSFGAQEEPTTSSYLCRPFLSTSNERCIDTGITSGAQVHVMVRGYAESSDYSVLATVTPAAIP